MQTISRGWIVNIKILFPAFLLLTDAFSWVTVQEQCCTEKKTEIISSKPGVLSLSKAVSGRGTADSTLARPNRLNQEPNCSLPLHPAFLQSSLAGGLKQTGFISGLLWALRWRKKNFSTLTFVTGPVPAGRAEGAGPGALSPPAGLSLRPRRCGRRVLQRLWTPPENAAGGAARQRFRRARSPRCSLPARGRRRAGRSLVWAGPAPPPAAAGDRLGAAEGGAAPGLSTEAVPPPGPDSLAPPGALPAGAGLPAAGRRRLPGLEAQLGGSFLGHGWRTGGPGLRLWAGEGRCRLGAAPRLSPPRQGGRRGPLALPRPPPPPGWPAARAGPPGRPAASGAAVTERRAGAGCGRPRAAAWGETRPFPEGKPAPLEAAAAVSPAPRQTGPV